MAPLDTDKYLRKLRELRQKHALEVVTKPGEISERNYAYAVGFQGGLDRAEKLIEALLKEVEKDFPS